MKNIDFKNGKLFFLDQTALPNRIEYINPITKCFDAGFRGNAREGISGICAGNECVSEYCKTDGG